ncbi:MAG: 1-acyl-sn-glycerol-3-phosphate acyltransferase [Pseudonocardiales bacterium]|nr:1-acyl-sn-glycerol-3-phosphate acyltransferase [Pseudonocardiales bacterium]MDQ1750261.1 1-acyl-sn-glycerol-3-phosphate acyltransferase [Pseudonocardiales bacterium]
MRDLRTEKPGPYLRFCVILIYPLTSLLWRRRWRGADRIPRQGPAILAINHISYADPFVIGRFMWDVGRLPRFLAKAALFRLPLLGRIVRGAGQIPVYRGTADANQALAAAVEALQRGEIVLIYPEGTVTRDPQFWPMQAKSGVARLALLAPDVPVIPVGQWGSHYFLDFYARKFRPFPRRTMTVSVGQPLDLSGYRGREPTADLLHEMTDTIMRQVRLQVAAIRAELPPEDFYPRPEGVGAGAKDAARPDKRESA